MGREGAGFDRLFVEAEGRFDWRTLSRIGTARDKEIGKCWGGRGIGIVHQARRRQAARVAACGDPRRLAAAGLKKTRMESNS